MGKLTVNIPEDIHQKVRDAVAAGMLAGAGWILTDSGVPGTAIWIMAVLFAGSAGFRLGGISRSLQSF